MDIRDNLFTPPGTYSFDSESDSTMIQAEAVLYSSETCSTTDLTSISALKDALDTPIDKQVQWIRMFNVNSDEALSLFKDSLDVHPLVLEGIVNPDHRTKFRAYDKYSCITAVRCCIQNAELCFPGVSILIFNDRIITFEEADTFPFESLKKRILEKSGKVRDMGVFYLSYCLLDVIVDEYFSTIELKYNQTADYEDRMMSSAGLDMYHDIHLLKADGFQLKNKMRPMREMTTFMLSNGTLSKENMLYLKDLHDHIVLALEDVESLRDTVSSLLELHFNLQGSRMNEIMKFLTLIATLFIPLTFIAGIYGMNFEYMPELKWQYSYPVLLGVMVFTAMGMIYFFKRKGWF